MTPDLCIYHGNCTDGFTAAWAVQRRISDIECVAGTYGDGPPDVSGRHVVLVDFSYKRPIIERMIAAAARLLIIDHHQTSEADLAFLPSFTGDYFDYHRRLPEKAYAVFDKAHSGAGLAWRFFHPEANVPKLVDYVEDRDLWRFARPYSREASAFLFSYAYEFSRWDYLANAYEDEEAWRSVIYAGGAILRKHEKDIAELLTKTTRRMTIGGVEVPVANLPYTMASDAAGILAESAPFAACYFDRNDGMRVFSLRARGDVDVSLIAANYGGGGHRQAAGFQMPIGWEGDA